MQLISFDSMPMNIRWIPTGSQNLFLTFVNMHIITSINTIETSTDDGG
jgi:hypothetical protein